MRLATIVLTLGVLPAMLIGCTSIQRGHEAVLALGDVSAGSEDSRLKRRTAEPEREDLRYSVDGRDYVADVYHPEEPRRGTLILVHGFTEEGRRDPRLTEFAKTMGRVGFTVFVPELDGLRDLSISMREAEAIADAIRYTTREDSAMGSDTGLAAISFAVGPALIASMQEDTAEQVRFLISVGGYYDLTDMLRYVTTGDDRGGAGLDAPPPQREGRWAVLLSQLHWLDDEDDRELLDTIAHRKLDNRYASVQREVRQLSSQGRAVYELVTNEDPDRVDDLIARMPPRLLEQFQALDLSELDLSRFQGQLVLIHGPDDRVIPVSHSRRLRDALPEGQVRLFEAGGLGHVDVSPGLRDGWGLWRATAYVLALGERE